MGGPRDTFHLTFDDAFRSVERRCRCSSGHGIPATFFACSGVADVGGAQRLLVPDSRREPEASSATMGWDGCAGSSSVGTRSASTPSRTPICHTGRDEELRRELG